MTFVSPKDTFFHQNAQQRFQKDAVEIVHLVSFFNGYRAYYLPGKRSTVKATLQLLRNLKTNNQEWLLATIMMWNEYEIQLHCPVVAHN